MWNQIPEARSRQVRMFWRWWKRRKDATWTKKHVWSLCFHNLMDKWFYLTSILGEELRKLLLQQGTLEQVEVQLEKQHVEEESDTLRGGWHSEASLAMEGWTTLLASFEAHIFWCIAILIFIYNYIDNTHTHIYIYNIDNIYIYITSHIYYILSDVFPCIDKYPWSGLDAKGDDRSQQKVGRSSWPVLQERNPWRRWMAGSGSSGLRTQKCE